MLRIAHGFDKEESYLISQPNACYDWDWKTLISNKEQRPYSETEEHKALVNEFQIQDWVFDTIVHQCRYETVYRFKSTQKFMDAKVHVYIKGHDGRQTWIVVQHLTPCRGCNEALQNELDEHISQCMEELRYMQDCEEREIEHLSFLQEVCTLFKASKICVSRFCLRYLATCQTFFSHR